MGSPHESIRIHFGHNTSHLVDVDVEVGVSAGYPQGGITKWICWGVAQKSLVFDVDPVGEILSGPGPPKIILTGIRTYK